MVNYLLNSVPTVGVLDLDVGQPEFEIPGVMSMGVVKSPLLGASGAHKVEINCRTFFGSTSPAPDPEKYLMAVQKMSEQWCDPRSQYEDHHRPPLIINTCGWITGLGDLLQKRTIEILKPSHIFALCESEQKRGEINQLLQGVGDLNNGVRASPQITLLPSMKEGKLQYFSSSIDSSQWTEQYDVPDKHPAEQRSLMCLRWAARCLDGDSKAVMPSKIGNVHRIASRLAGLHPWKVSLASIHVQFLFGKVDSTQIVSCINGAMVGLCKVDEILGSEDQEVCVVCFGVGLIRAIDPEANQIFVLTDIGSEIICLVNTIQVGKLRAPAVLCITNQHHPSWMVPRAFVNDVF